MLVLVLAVLLLVVAPGLLLFVGRAIQRATDGLQGHPVIAGTAPAQEAGDAWYRRGMLPAFYKTEEDDTEAQPL